MLTRDILLPVLACCVVATEARADSVAEAEHVRLTEEMRRLSKRNAWKGVEAAFVELEALKKQGVVLTYEDYFLGAQAARALGDINGVYARLKEAARVEGTEEVIGWLSELDANYGQVDLQSRRKEPVALTANQMPFAPDQRAAIEAAMASVQAEGRYQGLLPQGEYLFGDRTLTVAAGQAAEALTLVDEKAPRPEREPFHLAYVGPRVTIGPAYTSAGDPATVAWDEAGMQPPGFSGAGARAGLGVEVGVGRGLGAFAEVGYHGGFGAALDSADVPGSWGDEVPWDLRTRSINTGYGWLGGTWRLNALGVSAGPIWSVGSAYTDAVPQDGEAGACTDCVVAARGRIMAGGLAGGVSWAVADLGNLRGAIALHGGGQTDGARTWAWSQVAFTLSPASSRSE